MVPAVCEETEKKYASRLTCKAISHSDAIRYSRCQLKLLYTHREVQSQQYPLHQWFSLFFSYGGQAQLKVLLFLPFQEKPY